MIVALGCVATALTGCTASAGGAQAAVHDWLTALSEGRATDAMAYCTFRIDDNTDYLTSEVLAASLAAAPMTEVTVSRATYDADWRVYHVEVGYRLGDEQVNSTVTARPGKKSWSVDEGCVDVVLLTANIDKPIGWDVNTDWSTWQSAHPGTIALNGVSLTTTHLLLFPVAYQLSVESALMTMTGGHFIVSPSLQALPHVEGAVVLDDDTQRRIGAAAASALAGCLAERTETTTCGFSQTISYLGYDTTTIRWGVVDISGKPVASTVDPTKWQWERRLAQPDRVEPAGDQYESDQANFRFRIVSAKANRNGVPDITDTYTPFTGAGQPMWPCADLSDPTSPKVTIVC